MSRRQPLGEVLKLTTGSHAAVLKSLNGRENIENEIIASSDRYKDAVSKHTADDFRDEKYLPLFTSVADPKIRSKLKKELADEIYSDLMAGVIVYCDDKKSKLVRNYT